ncbi:glycosyltransferase, partial [Candidatus Woesearchaeota archaeon]|nr:glycosyltransferase [Candidatus Woesearchaeota archaeon]
MKILLITEYYPPKIFGGGELSAQALARSLAAKGIDVSVLTATVPGQKAEEHDNGVTIYRYLRTGAHPFALWENLKRMVLFPHSLRKTLQELDKRENFDVIHCVNTTSILHFRYPKKTIATINSYVPFCPKGNLFYKEKTVCTGPAFMKCCGCIAASQYIGKTKMKAWLRWNPLLWIWLYGAYCRRKARLKHMKRLIIISTFMRAFVDKRQATLIYT